MCLVKLEEQADRKFMKFSKDECQVLTLTGGTSARTWAGACLGGTSLQNTEVSRFFIPIALSKVIELKTSTPRCLLMGEKL